MADLEPAKTEIADPLHPFLDRQGVLILDGGLATELEARGASLADDLWSARLLLENPDLIRQVHLDYLRAGADCVTGASYQATQEGFMARGLGVNEATALLRRSVELAREARDRFWAQEGRRQAAAGRLRPLVAASIGPYGAYLADGSEYTGDYDLDEEGLAAFHRQRLEILASSGADLVVCETIPSRLEARVLARLLRRHAGVPAWFSFSCRDGRRLSDGDELAPAVAEIAGLDQVVAVGVNCTSPRFISDLIAEVRSVTTKPVVVYPNSGEPYDAAGKRWLEPQSPVDLAAAADGWHREGALLIGGCCRTRPDHICRIRKRLLGSRPPSLAGQEARPGGV